MLCHTHLFTVAKFVVRSRKRLNICILRKMTYKCWRRALKRPRRVKISLSQLTPNMHTRYGHKSHHTHRIDGECMTGSGAEKEKLPPHTHIPCHQTRKWSRCLGLVLDPRGFVRYFCHSVAKSYQAHKPFPFHAIPFAIRRSHSLRFFFPSFSLKWRALIKNNKENLPLFYDLIFRFYRGTMTHRRHRCRRSPSWIQHWICCIYGSKPQKYDNDNNYFWWMNQTM